jgi:hypothetical protein
MRIFTPRRMLLYVAVIVLLLGLRTLKLFLLRRQRTHEWTTVTAAIATNHTERRNASLKACPKMQCGRGNGVASAGMIGAFPGYLFVLCVWYYLIYNTPNFEIILDDIRAQTGSLEKHQSFQRQLHHYLDDRIASTSFHMQYPRTRNIFNRLSSEGFSL